ncbi:MAG: primosomal protein N' [Clostridia bacterium]|nr:primosomal protein N' [Deltaproteobacteria bacterium]
MKPRAGQLSMTPNQAKADERSAVVEETMGLFASVDAKALPDEPANRPREESCNGANRAPHAGEEYVASTGDEAKLLSAGDKANRPITDDDSIHVAANEVSSITGFGSNTGRLNKRHNARRATAAATAVVENAKPNDLWNMPPLRIDANPQSVAVAQIASAKSFAKSRIAADLFCDPIAPEHETLSKLAGASPSPTLPISPVPISPVRRARVVVNEPIGLLDYAIPDTLTHAMRPGMPVLVPLGKRRTSAYVVEIVETPLGEGITLKELEGLDAERPVLPRVLLDLIVFAASYYDATPGDVLAAALPALARPASSRFRITDKGTQHLASQFAKAVDADLLGVATAHPKGFTVAALEKALDWPRKTASSRVKRHVTEGWLAYTAKTSKGPRLVAAYRRVADVPDDVLDALKPKALALLEAIPLDAAVSASELGTKDPGAYERLRKLEKLGLVMREQLEQRLNPFADPDGDLQEQGSAKPPEPTREQQSVIADITETLDKQKFETFLLNGVTGSGKTEVYLRVIEHVLARGQTALVLVPEIALTPQLGSRFRSRFGGQVATFHSGLTVAERRDEWERVARGEARIGLGARSALFLPLTKVGIIIVDEEHETSFKQDESPRYNARDLAVFRGRKENAVVVLGSATPSLESRGNVIVGRYRELSMKQRVHGRPLPPVKRLDLAKGERVGNGIFTRELAQAVERNITINEQTVLFLNRRGFASVVYCNDCGHAYKCTDCDVSLTLHRRRGQLVCHYCGHEEATPDACSSCHGHNLEAQGLGTERIESELKTLLGEVPVARLDRDTVRKRSDLTRELMRFGRGEAKILIGTQMVAKGHDFPGVTLVGVISADSGLNFPDFRAAERTFQLLTQVAGRAGRGVKAGGVMVQTYDPEHYAIEAAARHDYEGFVEQELLQREDLGYPPYTHLVLSRYECERESLANEAARADAERLRRLGEKYGDALRVLGPAPAPLARLQGRYRVQVLIKAKERAMLRDVMRGMKRSHPPQVRQIIDVDPFSML